MPNTQQGAKLVGGGGEGANSLLYIQTIALTQK